ncbi:hypothetical protein MTO96_041492 [Rhipicephalus appendiculatus]
MTLRNDLLSLVKQTGIVPLTCELLKVAKENVPIEDYARMYTAANIIYPLLAEEEKPELYEFMKDFVRQRNSDEVSLAVSPRLLRFIFHGYKP